MDTAREFTDRLLALLRSERNMLADFILMLAEFDRRELFRQLGYASLFQFLQRELDLSDGLAYFRMKACRLVRDFPEVVEPLRDGRLCVTNMVELAKVITPQNRHEVLPRYFHVSKREAEAITVSIQPKAVVPTRSVVTPVRAPALPLEAGDTAVPNRDAGVGTDRLQPVVVAPASAPAPAVATPPRRAEVEPLTEELARFQSHRPGAAAREDRRSPRRAAAATISKRRGTISGTTGWCSSRARRGARRGWTSRTSPPGCPVRRDTSPVGSSRSACACGPIARWRFRGRGPVPLAPPRHCPDDVARTAPRLFGQPRSADDM